MEWEAWLAEAREYRERAYAPYSQFPVGALVVGVNGECFGGCNVENVSYGLTMCAERVAIGRAVAAGVREIVAVVVVAELESPIRPCGACLQVLAEFGRPEVLMVGREQRDLQPLSRLLPLVCEGLFEA